MNVALFQRPLQLAHPGADDRARSGTGGKNEISDPDFPGELGGTKRLRVLVGQLKIREPAV